MAILSQADLDFFDANGYVIARNVVPAENLTRVMDAVFTFLEMDPHNPEDWYRPPHRTNGMVELYHDQALWDNRQHPNVYALFSQIWKTEKLWVSEDRACMKPPQHAGHPDYDNKGFTHWDIDTNKLAEIAFGVQGVLCLTDTHADMGGFQCIPGFHKGLEDWVKTQPADRNGYATDLNALPTGMSVTPIVANAGDLIVWNTRLAHGNGHNVSAKPRWAQYITMWPASEDQAAREARIDRYTRRVPPPYAKAFPGDPRGVEMNRGVSATLSPLGRKLLGIDSW
jgi:Phytanoyl-CoA dioxygenase (PhyH)